MQKKEIIERAKEVCAKNHISEYPVNIVELCKSYGILVYQEYLPDDVSGFIVAQEELFDKYESCLLYTSIPGPGDHFVLLQLRHVREPFQGLRVLQHSHPQADGHIPI